MPQKLNSTIAVIGIDTRRGNRDLRALFVQAAWVVMSLVTQMAPSRPVR
jgi:hypothetical protein